MANIFIILSSFFISFIPPKLKKGKYAVFAKHENFVILTADSLFTINTNGEWQRRSHNFEFSSLPMTKVELDSKTFLVSAGIGEVYHFTGDSLIRIDNSFDHRSRYGSFVFEKAGRIYSFAGYGLLSHKNDIIYFDFKTREWHNEFVNQSQSIPEPMTTPFGELIDDQLFTGLGHRLTKSEKKLDRAQLNRIYKFNFLDYKWTQVAQIDNQRLSIENGKRYTQIPGYSPTLIMNGKNVQGIDMRSREWIDYPNQNRALIAGAEEIYFNSETAYFLIIEKSKEGLMYLNPMLVGENELLGFGRERSSLVVEKRKEILFPWSQLLVVMLIFIVSGFWIRNRKKVENPIRLLKVNMTKLEEALSTTELSIITKLISNYPDFVQFPDLLDNIDENLSYESRIKKLRASLKSIEQTVSYVLRTDQSIFLIRRNKNDKRVKEIGIKTSHQKGVFRGN